MKLGASARQPRQPSFNSSSSRTRSLAVWQGLAAAQEQVQHMAMLLPIRACLQGSAVAPKAAAAAAGELKRPLCSAGTASAPKRLCAAAASSAGQLGPAEAGGTGARVMLGDSFPPAASGELTVSEPLTEGLQDIATSMQM